MEQLITFEAGVAVQLPALDYGRVRRWIDAVAVSHSRRVGEVGYRFVDDEEILSVNREFLQHDYYTDIITFDYCRGSLLRGDIVLSLDTVASNAQQQQVDYDRELMRVIIHGILHLCGIDDKAPGARAVMESHEDAALELWDNMVADEL